MEEIIEIVVSLIGLIFYWLLTSRKSKSKKVKKVQPPRSARQKEQEVVSEPEIEQDVYEPEINRYEEEEIEKEEASKPLTFEELLEQFTGNKSKKPVFEAPDVTETSKDRQLTTRQTEEYLDEYKPLVKGGERLMQPGEHTGSILKKSIEELPTPKVNTPALRFDNYKKKNKKNGNIYAKKFKNKNSVRDALIMKEIFDRKYF